MQNNVYDEVKIFYDEGFIAAPVIKQEWVEGFLRQKAWQGINDAKLKDSWQQIRNFSMYLNHADNDNLDEITLPEYSLAMEWLAEHIDGFKATLQSVRHIFQVLIEFYTYLFDRKIIMALDELKEAAQQISGGKKLNLIKADSMLDKLVLFEDDIENLSRFDFEMSEELGSAIGEATEGLMIRLGKYFHGDNFIEDFERALYLYVGPFEKVSEEVEDEFWLGFWDYFLFDYHLLESDMKPLEYFNAMCGEKLNADEYRILQELLNSKFTVFYINKILNPNSVECVDLFTGQIFNLPLLDFNYKTLKKLLFFGHIFPAGLVMINYLTSIEMSINLRRRIKDEVNRQKEIFKVQMPDATLQDFFDRHALVLRHTVRILVTLSKVNVTSLTQLERSYPIGEGTTLPNQAVIDLLHELTGIYRLSLHDKQLIEKIWYDFSKLHSAIVRKPATWAAAVFCAYAEMNNIATITAKTLAQRLEISAASIHKNRLQLEEILQLHAFDARYLSEEGFVISLFEH